MDEHLPPSRVGAPSKPEAPAKPRLIAFLLLLFVLLGASALVVLIGTWF